MRRTISIALLAAVFLGRGDGGGLVASFAGNSVDPIVQQLVQMGQGEGAVMADAELEPGVTVPGEPVLLRMIVTAHPESAAQPEQLPLPPGLSYRMGGTTTSVAMTGQGIQFRTTFLGWITANAPGLYTIPAFTISANSRMVRVPAQTLRVVAAGSPEAAAAAQAPRMSVEVPAGKTFYVGQKVTLPVLLQDPGDNSVFGLTALKGEGNDFVFDGENGRQSRAMRNLGGRTVSVLTEWMSAVPVREGELPLVVQAVVFCRGGRHLQEILPGYQPLFESLPVSVRVRHLPKGELPGFTGLIGRFSVDPPQLTAASGRAGEPVELAVTVHGEGNLDRLVPPPAGDENDWQVVPAVPDSAPPNLIEQRGANTFRYTLVPRRAGRLATPRIPFSYFDPDKGTYADLTIPPVFFQADPAAGGVPMAVQAAAPAASPAGPGNVWPELAPEPRHFGAVSVPVSERAIFYWVNLGLAAGFLFWWGWDERRRYLAAHPEVLRRARARRELRQWERQLRAAAARGDATGFARAAVGALREGCAPVSAATAEALVGEDVVRGLPRELAGPEAEAAVRGLFGAVERWQYRGETPRPAVFAWRGELDKLLEGLRRRLC